jgi:hypothetical protein
MDFAVQRQSPRSDSRFFVRLSRHDFDTSFKKARAWTDPRTGGTCFRCSSGSIAGLRANGRSYWGSDLSCAKWLIYFALSIRLTVGKKRASWQQRNGQPHSTGLFTAGRQRLTNSSIRLRGRPARLESDAQRRTEQPEYELPNGLHS